MIGTCSESTSWFALFSHSTEVLTKCASQCKSPEMRCWSLNQVPKMSYGRFTTRQRKWESPIMKTKWFVMKIVHSQCQWKQRILWILNQPITLNTAISPEVECGLPKCTPETSNSVSLWLNCEYCVYFQLNFLISWEYLIVAGYDEFHIWIENKIAISSKRFDWFHCFNTYMNKTIFWASGKHASIVWEAHVQYLMRVCIL